MGHQDHDRPELAPAPAWVSSRRRHLPALLLLVVLAALLWSSERGRSVTADEPLHLIRGHAWWWKGDASLSYSHPPGANAITSLPFAGQGDRLWGSDSSGRDTTAAAGLESLPGWQERNTFVVGISYFRRDLDRALFELTRARRVMMLWTLALAAFLYRWCERRWGWPTAVISLALFALHPTLIAHGRLVTTDMPLTAGVLTTLAALIAWVERPGWWRVALFALAAAWMVLCKHSGLPMLVVMSLILLAAAWLGAGGFAAPAGTDRFGARLRRLAVCSGQLLLVATFVIVAIDSAYFFDRVGLTVGELLASEEPHSWISKEHDYKLLDRTPIAHLPEHWRLPFPFTWLVGLATISEQNTMGHGRYFFGLRDSAGHPLYFPVMIFAKSPAGLTILLGLALAVAIRRRHRPSIASSILLVFATTALASACNLKINIGVRHILPLFPITAIFAGRGAALALTAMPAADGRGSGGSWRRHWPAALVVGCLLGCVIGTAWTFPSYLGDFSLLVGGPRVGHRISVIGEDWGQDLGELAKVAERQGWSRINYYTRFPLRHQQLVRLGLEVQPMRCGRPPASPAPIVIHLSDWARNRNKCFAWLGAQEPTHVVAHHLLVFTRDPPLPRNPY